MIDFSLLDDSICGRDPASASQCLKLLESPNANAEINPVEVLRQTRLGKLLLIMKLVSPLKNRGAVAVTLSQYNHEYGGWTWVRDAALTMRQIVDGLRRWNRDPELRKSSIEMISDYIRFSRKVQDNAGLGEPRFDYRGRPYKGEWGRPQNDGPALRVLTLAPIAKLFYRSKSSDYKVLAHELYRAEHYENPYSILKRDLEFIAKEYPKKCKDLWEESTGLHFYTLMVQRSALIEGASVARLFEDGGAAAHYEHHAKKISELLGRFWNKNKRQIDVTLEGEGERIAKRSKLDIAVILSINHAGAEGLSFSALDSRVMGTALKIETWSRSAFSINSKYTIGHDGLELGPAIGRYPEDVYNGHPEENLRFTGAHPWVLATNGLGEYYLKVGIALAESGRVEFDSNNRPFFEALLKRPLPKDISVLDRSNREHPELFNEILRATQAKGLSFFNRVSFHLGTEATLPEMINGTTGASQSIPSLGWSDTSAISFLSALERLKQLLAR
jgi:glucoamylase